MISRCCCLLWLNTQTESVFVRARFSGADPPFPSSTCSPPKKCTASCGLTGGGSSSQHTLLAAGPTSTCVHFLFSSSVFVLVLERLRGNRQLGHFHVDHDAGGVEYDGLRDAFQSPVWHQHFLGDVTDRQSRALRALPHSRWV